MVFWHAIYIGRNIHDVCLKCSNGQCGYYLQIFVINVYHWSLLYVMCAVINHAQCSLLKKYNILLVEWTITHVKNEAYTGGNYWWVQKLVPNHVHLLHVSVAFWASLTRKVICQLSSSYEGIQAGSHLYRAHGIQEHGLPALKGNPWGLPDCRFQWKVA